MASHDEQERAGNEKKKELARMQFRDALARARAAGLSWHEIVRVLAEQDLKSGSKPAKPANGPSARDPQQEPPSKSN
jgi:hypothetical protein